MAHYTLLKYGTEDLPEGADPERFQIHAVVKNTDSPFDVHLWTNGYRTQEEQLDPAVVLADLTTDYTPNDWSA